MESGRRSLIIGVLLLSMLILVPTVIAMNLIIGKRMRIDELYKQSRAGILIEDKFLKHAEVIDYGGTTGKVLEEVDGYSFNIYAKVGDWFHFHYISTDIDNVMFYIYGDGWGEGTNLFLDNKDFEIHESFIYRIEVWNYDDENDGYITTFLIVYDEYYPPECPLC